MRGLTRRLRAELEAWMQRRSRQTMPPIVLRYRRVYILPTRNGWLFALLLAAMWLGAVNYSNSMIFIFAFLLVGIGIVSILHTFRNLVNLTLDVGRVEPVFAGSEAIFPITLKNDSRLPRQSIGLRRDGHAQGYAEVAPGGDAEIPLRVPTEHRGLLPLERFDAFTDYPLGLFVAWSPVWLSAQCVVYPPPEAGPIPAPPGGRGQGTGAIHSTGDDDFAGLRRYRAGDPIRHIAWKSLHDKELHTKQFSGQAATQLWLDYQDAALSGTEARLSRLCRWVLDAEREGKVFGLRLPGVEIPPASGPAQVRRCLEALAVFR